MTTSRLDSMLEALPEEQRQAFAAKGIQLGAAIASRLPADLRRAKDLVLGAADLFYKSPSRACALSFATAARQSAKCLVRGRDDAWPAGGLKRERLMLAEALEGQAVTLDTTAALLKGYNPKDTTMERIEEVRKNGAQLQRAEKATSDILVSLLKVCMDAAVAEIQAESMKSPSVATEEVSP